MKRRHTSEEPEPELKSRKRAKHAQYSLADLFSDPTSRRYVSGIIRNPTDDSGFITCQVFMLLKKPYTCFTAHTEEDEIGKTITQVEIHFQGYCLECLRQRKIQFDIGDKFMLALKGSSLYFGKKGRVILKYEDGALIQFTERRQAELDQSPIDTWGALSDLALMSSLIILQKIGLKRPLACAMFLRWLKERLEHHRVTKR